MKQLPKTGQEMKHSKMCLCWSIFQQQDTPCNIVPILTRACTQSKIHSVMNGHMVSTGMKQNHPQTMTAVPEQLGETYT